MGALEMKSALIKAAAGRKAERCVAFPHRAALLFPCIGDHYEPFTEQNLPSTLGQMAPNRPYCTADTVS